MAKVMLEQSSLNNIADAIRQLNGRNDIQYKPSEMAQAIDDLQYGVSTGNSYRVTIRQSPHQTIYVRKYLQPYTVDHYTSFTASEPLYYIDISIVADDGYQAGELNYSGTMLLEKDMVITATPATEV